MVYAICTAPFIRPVDKMCYHYTVIVDGFLQRAKTVHQHLNCSTRSECSLYFKAAIVNNMYEQCMK